MHVGEATRVAAPARAASILAYSIVALCFGSEHFGQRAHIFLIFFLLVSAAGFYLLYRTHSVWAYVQVGDPSPVPGDAVDGHWISTPGWQPEGIVHVTYAKRFPLFPGAQHRWVWKDGSGRLLARIDYPGPRGDRNEPAGE